MGRIGMELATRAKGLGMDVLYYDIRKELDVPSVYKRATLDEILAKSDFISLHVPIKKGEPALIGDNEFKKMKDGVYIINCAEAALLTRPH